MPSAAAMPALDGRCLLSTSHVGIQKPSARSSARPSGHQTPPAAAPPCPRSAGATSPKPLQACDRPPPPPLHARPVSCSDRAHIRAREACSAQRPWRMMQNTSRCRRVIGRRHHLRSTPAPLRPLAAAPPCPKSPRAREVCGGSKLEAALKLLNGKSSGPRPQFVPVPFGLNLPLDFVP